jgi:hypothetical protein
MNDEIIRQRIDDRCATRAHRGGPPILAIMEGPAWASRRSPLAARLRWPFEDGQALHPEVNIAKMHAEIPLIRRLAASVKIAESATPAQSP